MTLFAPEGSAEGCASGECLPGDATAQPPAVVAQARGASSGRPDAAPSKAPAPRSEERGRPLDTASPPAGARPGGPAAAAPPPPKAPTAQAAPEPRASLTAGDEDDDAPAPPSAAATEHERWRRAVDALRVAMPRHGKSLSYARFLGFAPEGVRIAFPPDAAFHRTQVVGMSRAGIEAELGKALGRPGKLLEEADAQAFAAAPSSIAEVEATDRAAREKQIEARVRSHPAVRSVLRHLGGGIEHIQYLEPATRDAAGAPPDDGEGDGSGAD